MSEQDISSAPTTFLETLLKSFAFLFASLFVLAGCQQQGAADKTDSLRIAVTTSTRDSGLLSKILPLFEKESNIRVDVLAVGTGAALELGRRGDVDLIIVHDHDAEIQFMADKAGSRRASLFSNQFVIIGPKDDPCRIKDMTPLAALKVLKDKNAKYISRGDDSGTHRKERSLLAAAGIKKTWPNCTESGRGMGATLTMAHQMQAYVLTDRATFLRFKSKIDLCVCVENHPVLDNPYSAIVINETLRGPTRIDAANRLFDFLRADSTKKLIASFECEGETPFVPMAENGG